MEMPTTTRGQDIFDMITGYLKKIKLTWKFCIGICTDGAPCMVLHSMVLHIGCIKGFASLAQKENPNLVRTHCFLHRNVLVSKESQENLKQVVHQIVEIVNYIKSRPIKSRLFEELCKSMDSQNVRLLVHIDVRWLSKGKVLTRVHELQKEVIVFFDKEKHERFCKYFQCEFWMAKMEYLAEIFGQLNIVNSSMQGQNENILTSTDKLVALKKKIVIWKNRTKLDELDMFPTMCTNCTKEMIPIVIEHLTALEENIDHYIPSLNTEKYDWVRNPFVDVPSYIGFKLCEEEKLATISSDRSLKIKHSAVDIDTFWISIQKEFPALAEKALLVLLQFSTSYLSELGFSNLDDIKNRKRERLRTTEEEIRICLSHIRPNIQEVIRQHQVSFTLGKWQFWDTNIINCIRQVHICIFLKYILWFHHIISKTISVLRQFHALVGGSMVKKVEKH